MSVSKLTCLESLRRLYKADEPAYFAAYFAVDNGAYSFADCTTFFLYSETRCSIIETITSYCFRVKSLT